MLTVLFVNAGAAYAAAGQRRITVAAASDLIFAMREIAVDFEKETGIKTTISFGSSGVFAAQIRSGAPYDLFFSADERIVIALKDDGCLVPESVAPYARGRLALVSKTKEITGFAALKSIKTGRIAIANPEHAPYGRAAKEALKSAGVYEAVKASLVYGENVAHALTFVETGDAVAGVVALSVARRSGLKVAPIDASMHGPIVQAAGVLRKAKDKDSAMKFIKYVLGAKGRGKLKEYGFEAP
ncbi:MAG: molybdate ABC transporter substrate-binding protein [Deltaproteobacteria bacterium]|nr:molybdate ABC transporter substrate-binding protein [Deltaproteobacteria bacterium]